jgi:hypothetical protein
MLSENDVVLFATYRNNQKSWNRHPSYQHRNFIEIQRIVALKSLSVLKKIRL